MQRFLGIDIGGTNVKFGVVSEKGELIEKTKHPTKVVSKNNNFMNNFITLLEERFNSYPDISKVGIGVPGMITYDRKSMLELANIPSLNGVNFVDTLEQKFPGKTFQLENDANAAALGEYYFGDKKNPESYMFITLGTGVGGGAILNKQIFKGGNGNAMEIGHIISGSGQTIEDHLGKRGIIKLTNSLIKKHPNDTKLKINDFDAKKVAKAAIKGDFVARKVYKKMGTTLGEACVAGIRILDINTILIGGGVSEAFKFMEKNMYKVIYEHLSKNYTDHLEIRVASLKNEAGILGAASLCFID